MIAESKIKESHKVPGWTTDLVKDRIKPTPDEIIDAYEAGISSGINRAFTQFFEMQSKINEERLESAQEALAYIFQSLHEKSVPIEALRLKTSSEIFEGAFVVNDDFYNHDGIHLIFDEIDKANATQTNQEGINLIFRVIPNKPSVIQNLISDGFVWYYSQD